MTNPMFPLRRSGIAAIALIAALSSIACGGATLTGPSVAPSAGASATTLNAEADASAFGTLAKGGNPGKPAPGGGTTGDDGVDGGTDDEKKKETKNTPPASDPAGDDDDDDDRKARGGVEVQGLIAVTPAASGTCPAKTFTVGTTTVVTSAATTYKNGACADLVAGARVSVDGTTQADGKVSATRVQFDQDDQDDDEDEDGDGDHAHPHVGPFDGTVSRLTGVCPAVSFNLQGMTIQTTAATAFVGGTCAMLRPNVQVTVQGTVPATGERIVTATAITITRRR